MCKSNFVTKCVYWYLQKQPLVIKKQHKFDNQNDNFLVVKLFCFHFEQHALVQKFGVSKVFFIFKELILLFGKDALIRSEVTVKTFIILHKNIWNKCCFFLLHIHQKILKNVSWFPQKYYFFLILEKLFLEQQISILEWFLKARVMMLKIQLCIPGINYMLKCLNRNSS